MLIVCFVHLVARPNTTSLPSFIVTTYILVGRPKKLQVKGKFLPRTGHEGPEGE